MFGPCQVQLPCDAGPHSHGKQSTLRGVGEGDSVSLVPAQQIHPEVSLGLQDLSLLRKKFSRVSLAG